MEGGRVRPRRDKVPPPPPRRQSHDDGVAVPPGSPHRGAASGSRIASAETNSGDPTAGGHSVHMRAINAVRRAESIAQAVKDGTDCGTHQAVGLVTNAQDFMSILQVAVERQVAEA